MRNRVVALAGAVLLVAATQNAALSQTRPNWQNRLDLTDEQKAQIEELQQQHRAAAAEAQAEIIKARAEVQSLSVQPDADLDALLRAMNRLSELENSQQIQAMRNRKALEDVLTEEQKNNLRSVARTGAYRFLRDRFGRGRAFGGRSFGGRSFRGRAGSFTLGRSARDLRSFNRGTQRRGGRGIPPQPGAGLGWGGRGIPPQTDAGFCELIRVHLSSPARNPLRFLSPDPSP